MRALVVLVIVGVTFAKHEEYTGWKSYYVEPQNHEQLKNLSFIIPQFDLDFLSNAGVNHRGLVLVKPHHQAGFTKTLESWKISYSVHNDDIVGALKYEDQLIEERNREIFSKSSRKIPYDNYQPLEVFYDYLDEIAAKYPDVVTLVEPTKSYEGRPIKYLKISTTNFEDINKPVIFIDAGIHAREWITPPAVTWAIHKLVENVTEPDLLERFDWILLPIVNPDGYHFTHTTERYWRKTRSSTSNLSCRGVDGNRNYDFFWSEIGTSSDPCSYLYGGPSAFSEVEVRVVRDILHEHLSRMALYLTMHSFGSMILYPWGHDGTLSNNALALHTVGIAMADAIYEHTLPNFPRYVVGNAAQVLYGVSGAAEDYAHSIGVPLTYCYELPGLSGEFHLAPQYIEPVCKETWEGIVVGARRAGDLFVPLP